MFPSFYGMQPYIYEDRDPPNLFQRSIDKLLLGASHYRIQAESSGTLHLVLQRVQVIDMCRQISPNGRFFHSANNRARIYF